MKMKYYSKTSYIKKAMVIFAKENQIKLYKLYKIIEKLMVLKNVLCFRHSTQYIFKKSARELENEKLKIAILKYYKENKCRYCTPKIMISKMDLIYP